MRPPSFTVAADPLTAVRSDQLDPECFSARSMEFSATTLLRQRTHRTRKYHTADCWLTRDRVNYSLEPRSRVHRSVLAFCTLVASALDRGNAFVVTLDRLRKRLLGVLEASGPTDAGSTLFDSIVGYRPGLRCSRQTRIQVLTMTRNRTMPDRSAVSNGSTAAVRSAWPSRSARSTSSRRRPFCDQMTTLSQNSELDPVPNEARDITFHDNKFPIDLNDVIKRPVHDSAELSAPRIVGPCSDKDEAVVVSGACDRIRRPH